ncbi:mucin-2-like [Ylistrum balloti]|uniref:mucin-2-like n=1 Tax=Ylistrum balloti TaxID=509963 RepID=UPI0029059B48|nr:mucin-2-like [Ylistrum balloti]
MNCQQMAFVWSVVLMCFVAGKFGRRSCPAGRQTVDICTPGTVHGSETLLIDFSPEVGINSCNCNFTIDGARLNISSLTTPQNSCGSQLEVDVGLDYLEVDCNPVNKSYNTSEIKRGNIWTTGGVFHSGVSPQDLCLEFTIEGGASTVTVTCTFERNWERGTTTDVTLGPEAPSSITKTVGLTTPALLRTTTTTDPATAKPTTPQTTDSGTSTADILEPPASIRDEILKLAKNDEKPVVFEDANLLVNTEESIMEDTTTNSEGIFTDVTASGTTSVPILPPKDIMDTILEIANATKNPIRVEHPSTTPLQNVTSDGVSKTTTLLPQPLESSVRLPIVPPTDIMSQLLDIANNGTNKTIVFPEFADKDVSSQTSEQATLKSTVLSEETTTPQKQTTEVSSLISSTTTQQTTGVDIMTTVPSDVVSTQQPTSMLQKTQATTVVVATKQSLETTTPNIKFSTTGYDQTLYDGLPANTNDDDWTSHPESTTSTTRKTTTQAVRKAPRGDIEITTQTDRPEMTSVLQTTSDTIFSITTQRKDPIITTTLPDTDDVTRARNGTGTDDTHETKDTVIVIIVGSIIGIIVIVAIIAIIRAFCKSRRKSANITMVEKGGMENGGGATTGIDNPLVQLQQEQEMVETNPNPVDIQSGKGENNGKMEANFSEGTTEMNGNGVSNSPRAGDVDMFQSSASP